MEPASKTAASQKVVHQKFQFGPWTVSSCKSHILESEGPIKDLFDEKLELPQLPEMVFAGNFLRIQHESGSAMDFKALDALELVNAHSDPVKVAASEEWRNARSACEHIENVVSPFDWTYTTNYKGTIIQGKAGSLTVSPTDDRINLDNLKKKETIHFFDDVILFEDELADNGTCMLNVKIRVMPSCLFVLMRFFVRVDQVLIRVNETRIFHEAGTNYMLREYSSKEEKTANIPTAMHTNPNEVSKYLKLNCEEFEKLEFSQS